MEENAISKIELLKNKIQVFFYNIPLRGNLAEL